MPPPQLPTPGPAFARKKATILSQLAVPDDEYTDASPKGSVDVGIRALIDGLNKRDGLVTTSSCAGRVSVYLEGRKKGPAAVMKEEGEEAVRGTAAVGGKGGGEWLFVSHERVEERGTYGGLFGLVEGQVLAGDGEGESEERLIHFKFEPMILHVLTASVEHAQLVIQAGMGAGFRETGAVSLLARGAEEEAMPVVAVRSMGLSFESLIGVESDEKGRRRIVGEDYLKSIVRIANERFTENEKRIARLEEALEQAFAPKGPVGWEDAETRRERKREEGLRRKGELKKQHAEAGADDKLDLGLILQAPDML